MNFIYKNILSFSTILFFILLFTSVYTGNWIYFGLVLVPIMLFTFIAIFMRFSDFFKSTSETLNTHNSIITPDKQKSRFINDKIINPDFLFYYEKMSALKVKDILESKRKNKDILKEINELSIKLYYLSFKRTEKKIVEIGNIDNNINSEKYYDILGRTRSILIDMADEVSKPSVIETPILLESCEILLLKIIKKNVEKLNSL